LRKVHAVTGRSEPFYDLKGLATALEKLEGINATMRSVSLNKRDTGRIRRSRLPSSSIAATCTTPRSTQDRTPD